MGRNHRRNHRRNEVDYGREGGEGREREAELNPAPNRSPPVSHTHSFHHLKNPIPYKRRGLEVGGPSPDMEA